MRLSYRPASDFPGDARLSPAELLTIDNDAASSSGLPSRAYTGDSIFHWERDHEFSPTGFAIVTGATSPTPPLFDRSGSWGYLC